MLYVMYLQQERVTVSTCICANKREVILSLPSGGNFTDTKDWQQIVECVSLISP